MPSLLRHGKLKPKPKCFEQTMPDPKDRSTCMNLDMKSLVFKYDIDEDFGIPARGSVDATVYKGQLGHVLTLMKYGLYSEAADLCGLMWTTAKFPARASCSFHCGRAGKYAVCAVVFPRSTLKAEGKKAVALLTEIGEQCLQDRGAEYEVLYGLSSFLIAAQFVNGHLGAGTVPTDLTAAISRRIIEAGVQAAQPCPLAYSWRGKNYLGAAHGTAGVLFVLLQQALDDDALALVRASVDYLVGMQGEDGGWPATVGDYPDPPAAAADAPLVQWCHGAPGFVPLLVAAYKRWGDVKYLAAAERAADATWKKGLIRKGLGVCHGIPGNAYAFLALFRATGDLYQVERAARFAEFAQSQQYKEGEKRPADTPASLYEGDAGLRCLLHDVRYPATSYFPGFEPPPPPPSTMMVRDLMRDVVNSMDGREGELVRLRNPWCLDARYWVEMKTILDVVSVHESIYSVPCFSPVLARAISDEVVNFTTRDQQRRAGIALGPAFDAALHAFVEEVVQPTVDAACKRHVYGNDAVPPCKVELDSAVVLMYEEGGNEALSPHVDTHDVTFNINLDGEGSMGSVNFHIANRNGDLRLAIPPSPGYALLHEGMEPHSATEVHGSRVNLVLKLRWAAGRGRASFHRTFDYLDRLPQEVVALMVEWLDGESLLNLALVSKWCHALASQPARWRLLYARRQELTDLASVEQIEGSPEFDGNWKREYLKQEAEYEVMVAELQRRKSFSFGDFSTGTYEFDS